MGSITKVALLLLLISAPGRSEVFWQRSERIVGGSVVEPHSAPFTVLVRYGFARCGGVILDETTIVTAAHCSDAFYTVIAGDHNRFVEEGTEQERSVVESFIHPLYINYDDQYTEYDVAVLKLDQPLTFNEYVQPMKLATAPMTGNAVAYGWGQTERTTYLKELNTVVLSDSECESKLASVPEEYQPSNMICAQSNDGSICFGDSGGPLICEGEVLCGISSWVVAGCTGQYPQVFAEVAELTDFITDPANYIEKFNN